MERVKYIDFGRNHGTGRMDLKKARKKDCHAELNWKTERFRSRHQTGACPARTKASGNPTKAMQAKLMATAHPTWGPEHIDRSELAYRCEL